MRFAPFLLTLLFVAPTIHAQRLPAAGDFKTDLSKKSIELSELRGGGPPKDGIPAIHDPKFDTVREAAKWLDDKEPVLVVRHAGETRVYPFQILIFHEMANDVIGDLPVLATYCPLCNSAIAFDRRIDGKVYDFGVSGMLRNSDMIMYDRQTDSLWQQLTGEAVVGDLTGKTLTVITGQVVDFGSVKQHHPDAKVLNRDTGHQRPYGQTPYAGYESNGRMMFPVKYKNSDSIRPLERLVAVKVEGAYEAVPLKTVAQSGVEHGKTGGQEYVIFYDPTAVGAMDSRRIADSEQTGSVGVFSPVVDGETLKFRHTDGKILDKDTGSEWNIFGEAVAGEYKGKRLEPVNHGVYYAFAWLAFRPETKLKGVSSSAFRDAGGFDASQGTGGSRGGFGAPQGPGFGGRP